MGDLIERHAAIDFRVSQGIHIDGVLYVPYCEVMMFLASLPSAQPEIVRCKDCAKREICRTTNVWSVAPDDDWYCADGERIE